MTALDSVLEDALCVAALAATEKAYAPYSRFQVGAALLCADGSIVLGCNVENASYGLCLCAERTAIGNAIVAGHRHFTAIAVATSSTPPSSPCGMCRQVLAEFASDMPVVLVNHKGIRVHTTTRELLPMGFTPSELASGQAHDRT